MPAQAPDRAGLLTQYTSRFSRDTLLYSASLLTVFPFSLVQAAVLTRFLPTSAYGELAVMLVLSSFLTLAINAPSLQGALIYIFGAGGDEDAGPVDDETAPLADDKRRAATTGFVVTTLTAVALSLPLMLSSAPLSRALLNGQSSAMLVFWACMAALTGALYRFTMSIARLERRSGLFASLIVLRPALVVALSCVLVATGHGVQGALVGTALGSAVVTAYALVVGHGTYGLSVSAHDARQIFRSGRRVLFYILGISIIHNADVLFVSQHLGSSDAGVYRLAERIASVPSYFVSAFLLAMAPLERSTLTQAVYAERPRELVRSEMLVYYVIGALGITLGLSVAADVLVQIAASSYAGAATLIPIIALSFVAYGMFVLGYRAGSISHARAVRFGVMSGGIVVYVALANYLPGLIGAWGPPVATIVAFGGMWLAIIVVLAGFGESIIVPWFRLAMVLLAAAICFVVGTQLSHTVGTPLHVAISIAALILFPILLVVFGAVPREHVRGVWHTIAGMVPRPGRGRQLVGGVADLDPRRRIVVESIVRDRLPVDVVAEREGVSAPEVHVRLTRALRQISLSDGAATTHDAALGAYLGDRGPAAARDAHARDLQDQGVDPYEIHVLDDAVRRLRQMGARRWP